MKNLKRGLFTFLLFLMFTAITLSSSCSPVQAKTKKVSLTKKVTMNVGKTKKLVLKNNKKKVKWTSSNKKVVKITKSTKKNATIKALKKGSAKITAKIGKKKYTCKVTVKKAASAPSGSPSSNSPNVSDTDAPNTEDSDSNDRPDSNSSTPGVTPSNPADSEPSTPPETYTYSVTPLLAPFDDYFYVQTNNPDPSGIRFVDTESKYYTAADTTPCLIVPTSKRFLDVSYENKSTGRVAGGYIFERQNRNMDGGSLTMQKQIKVWHDYYYTLEYVDTPVTVNCPEVKSYLQYLIDTYTAASMTFFEKMDAIQAALDDLALYPRSVLDKNKRSTVTPYPLLAASPYSELTSLNEWYAMYDYSEEGLFLNTLYPFILNSASFPSSMYAIAQMLDSSCTIEWGSAHYQINVTKDGITKVYGGAGSGGNDPIYTNRVETLFLFDGSDGDYAAHAELQTLRDKSKEYGELATADAEVYRKQLRDEFSETVSPGSWIKVAVEGASLANKGFAYVTQGTQFSEGSQPKYVSPLKSVWIDGRYINECNIFEKGAAFKDHPTADIVIRNMEYTDMKGVKRRGDVRFQYDAASGTWKSNAYTFGYIFNADELVLPDDFILTQEEVDALDVDRNTNTDPTAGFIYDGSAEPGTPLS